MRAERVRGAAPGASAADRAPGETRNRAPGARVSCLAAVLAAVLVAPACTEDPLTGPGPEEGENEAARTVEISVSPSQMDGWRDTTFTGFAIPADGNFLVLADEQDFQSRALVRYPAPPDTVVLDSDTLAVEGFRNGRVGFVVDTAGTTVPAGGMALRVLTLARGFDPEEATWQQASEGTAWQSPGGDFDQEVGRRELSVSSDSLLPDTVAVDLGAKTDSLLKAWDVSGGRPGIAGVVEGTGARVRVTSAVLQYDIKPAGRDTTVPFQQGTFLGNLPSTFIFDPPNPPPSGDLLRLGGMPASRFYVSFRPPREVEGARIPGSTVNRAELVFRPAAPPSSPFALRAPVTLTGVRLLADPFRLGARTPIGDTLAAGSRVLDPDSLAAGRAIRFEFTNVLARWASNPDSAGSLRVGVRLSPDAQSVGFWEFGSAASAAALQPFLRIVVTPPSDFEVP